MSKSMVSPDLLRASFEQVLAALHADGPAPFGHAILHDAQSRPVAIILVADDPEIATRLAALLPRLVTRLGVAD